MPTIPNLFPEHNAREAKRLYSLYLSRLMAKSRERRILEACRQIRSYAARSNEPGSADFTFHFEIDALCKLRRFGDAWRQLRRLERIAFGKPINLSAKDWEPEQLEWFWNYHPQILFFMGRHRVARRLLEALLSEKMARAQKGLSYELLPYVYKLPARPRDRGDVTLYHLYRKLGQDLVAWQHWEKFVNGFDPGLFRLAGIEQQDLLRDASQLRRFWKAINKERKARLVSNVTTGEPELLDSPQDVQRFQDEVARKRAPHAPAIAQIERKLRELFPELR